MFYVQNIVRIANHAHHNEKTYKEILYIIEGVNDHNNEKGKVLDHSHPIKQ